MAARKSVPVAPGGRPGTSTEVPEDLYARPSRALSEQDRHLGPILRKAIQVKDEAAINLTDALNELMEAKEVMRSDPYR